MDKGNTKLVKKINKYHVIQCIMKDGPLSQEDIVHKTRLSRPTVIDIIKEIQNENLVSKIGMGTSSGGRIPNLFGIEPMGYFSIGIDFEYPDVHIGIMNFINEPIRKESFQLADSMGIPEIISELLSKVGRLIDEFEYPRERIVGIGIGLPGIIDLEKGVSTKIERIQGWSNIPLKSVFEDQFGIQTFLNNDVHLIANFERSIQEGLPDSFIYVGIRAGIGMAAVYKEGTYTGYKGNAGFLGHMTVDIDGPKCVCGHSGCLEAIAGEMSLRKKYYKTTGRKLELDEDNVSVYECLTNMADNGDETADGLIMEASKYLAYGVANVMKILEIPTIVLSGWPSTSNRKYIDFFENQLREQLFCNLLDDVKIIFSKGQHSMAIKACSYYVFENFMQSRYVI